MDKLLVPCSNCASVNRLDLADTRNKSPPLCGACKTPLPVHGNVVEASGHGLANLLRAAQAPVVIDFWAPWCGPCKTFAPDFEEAAEKLGRRFHFLKVNADSDPTTSARYNVRGIPTLVVLHNGSEIERQPGAMPLSMLLSWLERIETEHPYQQRNSRQT